jgi:hypothetical protein
MQQNSVLARYIILTLSKICRFFSLSTKRWNIRLKTMPKGQTLKIINSTQWASRADAVSALKYHNIILKLVCPKLKSPWATWTQKSWQHILMIM